MHYSLTHEECCSILWRLYITNSMTARAPRKITPKANAMPKASPDVRPETELEVVAVVQVVVLSWMEEGQRNHPVCGMYTFKCDELIPVYNQAAQCLRILSTSLVATVTDSINIRNVKTNIYLEAQKDNLNQLQSYVCKYVRMWMWCSICSNACTYTTVQHMYSLKLPLHFYWIS